MSTQMLQTFLTLLRRPQVEASAIVDFLEKDSSADVLGFGSLIHILKSFEDKMLDIDIVNRMINITEHFIKEKNNRLEEEISESIVKNTFTNYREQVTVAPVDINDKTVINSYHDQDNGTNLEYYVLYCPLEQCRFKVSELIVSVSPLDKIPFTDINGQVKNVSYKFKVDIRAKDPNLGIDVGKKYDNSINYILKLIGMSFIDKDKKNTDLSVIDFDNQKVTIEINTMRFFTELITIYNSYYKNIRKQDGSTLDEIAGIESCLIDTNGLILVPKLFYLSSLYFDGAVYNRPFTWGPANNQIVPPENIVIASKFELKVKLPNKNDTRAVDILVKYISESQLRVTKGNVIADSQGNGGSVYLNFNDHNDRRSISSNTIIERKLSETLRKIFFRGKLSFSTMGFKNGYERYDFSFDSANNDIKEVDNDRDRNNYTIHFNRESYKFEGQNNVLNFDRFMERNNAKNRHMSDMISYFTQNYVTYMDQQLFQDVHDYLPTSVNVVSFEKNKQPFYGFSFLPFGFLQYLDPTLKNGSQNGSNIYGSVFEMSQVQVRRIIKLSKNKGISNIIQIIVESKTEPVFEIEPLLTTALNSDYYLALFRSKDKDNIRSQSKIIYAADYMETIDKNLMDETDKTVTLNLLINPDNSVNVSRRAMLRYGIESLGDNSPFTSTLIENVDKIFGYKDSIDLIDFLMFFKPLTEEEKAKLDMMPMGITIPGFERKFFDLLKTAGEQGVVNENIISAIMGICEMKDQSIIRFIQSVKIPVKRNDCPFFTADIQTEITKQLKFEFESIKDEVYRINDKLIGVTGREIISIASTFNGISRKIIEMIGREIGDEISTNNDINELRKKILDRFYSEISSPVLPTLTGRQIDIDFIKNAANSLSSDIFLKLLNIINAEIRADSYEDIILSFLQNETSPDDEFIVRNLSPHRYNITFDSSLRDYVLGLNDKIIPELGYKVFISDGRYNSYELGQYTYDHNIHAMFEIKPNSNDVNINNLLVDTLQNTKIYYSQINGNKLMADLSLVSIYNIPEILTDGIHFFLPYNFDDAKLTVESVEWSNEEATFNLVTKTVEIELISKDRNFSNIPDINGFNAWHQMIRNESDPSVAKTVVISTIKTERFYTRPGVESRFYFTEDVSTKLKSGEYSVQQNRNGIFPIDLLKSMSGELELSIYPTNPIFVKYSIQYSSNIETIFESYFNKFNIEDKKDKNKYIKKFLAFSQSPLNFEDQFSPHNSVKSTMLITKNKRGIYSTIIGSLDTEARIAKGNIPFNYNKASVDMKDVEKLTFIPAGNPKSPRKLPNEISNDVFDKPTSVEERFLKNQIDIENRKLDHENIKHNMGLLLSTIRWNTKQIKNYRFINNEIPKWIKFSPDSYFMAIAFKSGVKIYIASGDRYIFCNNLVHEGVSEIAFGNNNLCVTTQYDDSNEPFSKLWLTATGIMIKEIPFYKLVTGDAADVTYATGTGSTTKKKVLITLVGDYVPVKDENGNIRKKKNGNDMTEWRGNVFFNNTKVDSSVPIFNHNVYFFSPDDRYVVYNIRGSFIVIDMHTKNHNEIKFETLNGLPVKLTVQKSVYGLKCLESCVWVSNKIFMAISYNSNEPNVKTRLFVNVENKSIVQSDIAPDFPTLFSAESMLVDSYKKTHPLYTYLISEKHKYIDETTGKMIQNGVWLWDLYISIVQTNGTTVLKFNTEDGLESFYELRNYNVPLFNNDGLSIDGQNILDYLMTILKTMSFSSIEDETGEHIYVISWIDNKIFDRSMCKTNLESNIQVIEGNYFAFNGSSIYIWNYRTKIENFKVEKWTELSHIDSNGYQRLTFENHHLAILIGDHANAGIFTNGSLEIRKINLTDKVDFNMKTVDISAIKKPYDEKYKANFFATTEVSFEYYDNEVSPVLIDTKKISSAMCLNRFPDYTTLSHRDSKNEKVNIYDNLMITCDGNTVRIIPKSVPINNTLNGLNDKWYNSQNDVDSNYWFDKKSNIQNYLIEAEQILQLPKMDDNSGIFYKLKLPYLRDNIFAGGSSKFERSISLLITDREKDSSLLSNYTITDEEFDRLIVTLRFFFEIFQNVAFLTTVDDIIKDVKNYWILKLPNKFTNRLNNFPISMRRQFYNEFVAFGEYYIGKKFLPYNVGLAFRMIDENSTYKGIKEMINVNIGVILTKINGIEDNFNVVIKEVNSEGLTFGGNYVDPETLNITSIAKFILKFPYREQKTAIDIKTYEKFKEQIKKLKNELLLVELMLENVTNYDIYHAIKDTELNEKFYRFLIKKLSFNEKIDSKQEKPDYEILLLSDPRKIRKPVDVSFKGKKYVKKDDVVYMNNYMKVKYSDKPVQLFDRFSKEYKEYMKKREEINRLNKRIKKLEEDNEILMQKEELDNFFFDSELREKEKEREMFMNFEDINSKKEIIKKLSFETDEYYNKTFKKEEPQIEYEDGDYVDVIDNLTFSIIRMRDVINDYQGLIMKFLKEKVFILTKDKIDVVKINSIICQSVKNGDLLTFVKQLIEYLKEKFVKLETHPTEEEFLKAMTIFNQTVIRIGEVKKSFKSLDSYFNLISRVFESRFPVSLYGQYDEIPSEILRAFELRNENVSRDSEEYILEHNIPYINNMFKFYERSKKNGYYLTSDNYTPEMDAVKKRLIPMLWKYRQGVCEKNIPVVAIKLVFDKPVIFEGSSSSKQSEDDDIIFKYEMDSKMVKHNEKYGEIKVNLMDIILKMNDRCNTEYLFSDPGIINPIDGSQTLFRRDGSSNIKERLEIVDSRKFIKSIIDDFNILKTGINSGLITEEKAINYINRDKNLVKVLTGNNKIDSLEKYIEEVRNLDSNSLNTTNFELIYNTRSHYLITGIQISYNFVYVKEGIQFNNVDISMKYEDKENDVVKAGVDLSRKYISINNVKPLYYDPRLLRDESGKPFIFTNSTGERFIVWYGNTKLKWQIPGRNKETPKLKDYNVGFIVTQNVLDRSMKTFYYKKDKFMKQEMKEMKKINQLRQNYYSGNNVEVINEIVDTYINDIRVDSDGNLIINERVPIERPYINGPVTENITSEPTHISQIFNSWTYIPYPNEFGEILINSTQIKSHGNMTICVSKYTSDNINGSIVEVFTFEDGKFNCSANWNFNGYNIINFDFNETSLYLVGIVKTFDGVNVRIGEMFLTKNKAEKKPIFVNFFDREIDIANNSFVNILNVSINTKDSTFITYDDGKTSIFITINSKTSYEKTFNDPNMGLITSMNSSTKNGYVALYFAAIDKTQVWTCDGTLYDSYDGECYWM